MRFCYSPAVLIVAVFICSGALEKEAKCTPYLPAQEIVNTFGLSHMRFRIDKTDVQLQSTAYVNQTKFEDALKKALESFLGDSEDVESPLALIIEDVREQAQIPEHAGTPDMVLQGAKSALKGMMNRPSTFFALVSEDDYEGADGVLPPEHGEKLKDSWMFFLSMPDYSDHTYWAVVSRAGKVDTYNYGFN